MILHTVVAMDEVMGNSGNNISPQPEYKYYKLKSGVVCVSGKTRCVNSVFSTDLSDYLDKSISPGAKYL